MAFADSGLLLTSSGDGIVGIDIRSEKLAFSLPSLHPSSFVRCIDVDMHRIYTGGTDSVARVTDFRSLRVVAEYVHDTARRDEEVRSLAAVPGEGLLTACYDGCLRFWSDAGDACGFD